MKRERKRAFIAALLLTLAIALPVWASQTLYIADDGAVAVFEWPTTASGNTAPSVTLNSSSFTAPVAVALDGSGNIWVTDVSNAAIYEFPPGSSGTVAPAHSFAGASTNLSFPIGISFDAAGDLWVADDDAASIFEWTAAQVAALLAGGSSNIAPANSITYVGFVDVYDVIVDSTGRIIVADATADSLDVFASGASGASTPTFTVTTSPGLNSPEQIVLDASGRVWVSNVDAGNILLLDLSGCTVGLCVVTPTTTISATQPAGIGLDSAGNLWAGQGVPSIASYSVPSGSLLDTIAGDATGLQDPLYMALSATATPTPTPTPTPAAAATPSSGALGSQWGFSAQSYGGSGFTP